MQQHTVYAIHNFEAENEDEITFKEGEPIVVLEKDEKYMDGWWQGRNVHGHVGLFPMNYITSDKPTSFSSSTSNTAISTTTNASQYSTSKTLRSSLSQQQRQSSSFSLEDKIDNAISEVQTMPSPEATVSEPARKTNPLQQRPELWDTHHVALWLESVGLQSVVQNFVDQEITGDVLLDLTADALKELNIATYGKRYKIMQAIHELKDRRATAERRGSSAAASRKTAETPPMSPPSPVSSDGSYRARKAAHPRDDMLSAGPSHHPSLPRPVSPQSLGSPAVSRSNTFNTMSSKKSSSSAGTFKSEERIPLPKIPNGLFTRPNASRDTTFSSAPSSMGETHTDWMTESNLSSMSSMHDPDRALTDTNGRKLSVASVDPQLTADPFQAPEHEGWLHKQSERYKTWNKRWFVLKGSNLFYFKSPKDVRMKGIINLRGYRIVVDESIHSGKYSFKAQHDRERTFYFYCDTEDAMRAWIKVLIKTTIARDISTPVISSNPVATVSLDAARKMRPRPPSMIMYNRPPTTLGLPGDPKISLLEEEEEEDEPVRSRTRSLYSTSSSSRHLAESARSIPDLPTPNAADMVYLDWLNAQLPDRNIQHFASLRDGEILLELLETLSHKEIRRPPQTGDASMHMLDTMVAAFKFMGREGIVVDGQYTIKDIFSGNESKIIRMLSAIKAWSEDLQDLDESDAYVQATH
ncbi:hypothetical protein BCR43DRAFT_521070 [Syncephalastrum racemosum]|uniref:Polar growth protein n=1 Tax=Syncephalastrum racemosum TaxID=13706 RepID=A0A1X2HKK4_SYNRA|nr:hypothetical protein BCR43DRAFT_521070 [Syncephalastrum racemosum]